MSSRMRDRVMTQFPVILLTLISIIQALALELLWGKVLDGDYLWQWDLQAIVAWGSISVTMLGILQVWVLYSTLVLGFTWRPTMRDMLLPFVIGLLEFSLVSLIGPDFDALWLYALAGIFLFGNTVAHITFRRARLEIENAAFFRGRSPATWRNFIWAFSNIFLLIIFGILYTALRSPDWIALTAMVFANGALLVQMVTSRRLWKAIVETED